VAAARMPGGEERSEGGCHQGGTGGGGEVAHLRSRSELPALRAAGHPPGRVQPHETAAWNQHTCDATGCQGPPPPAGAYHETATWGDLGSASAPFMVSWLGLIVGRPRAASQRAARGDGGGGERAPIDSG
jgi:hypothetical protein